MLLAVLGLSLNLSADPTRSCNIVGSEDGATVVAAVIEVGDGWIKVEFSNDGEVAVNVTVRILAEEENRYYRTSTIVPPQSSKVQTVQIPTAKASDSPNDYDINELFGKRCTE